MNDITGRLTKCFQTVFPQLSEDQVLKASIDNLSTWDSVNHIMLVTVITEEFGFDFDYESLDQFGTFQAFMAEVQRHQQVS
jgi:acyl carrier protein